MTVRYQNHFWSVRINHSHMTIGKSASSDVWFILISNCNCTHDTTSIIQCIIYMVCIIRYDSTINVLLMYIAMSGGDRRTLVKCARIRSVSVWRIRNLGCRIFVKARGPMKNTYIQGLLRRNRVNRKSQ